MDIVGDGGVLSIETFSSVSFIRRKSGNKVYINEKKRYIVIKIRVVEIS